MAERVGCAAVSVALGEPCYGTASQVRRWILVEQPGPWGSDAVGESRLPAAVATALKRAARAAGARLLLIRRHGRSAPTDLTAFAVVSTPEVRRVERLPFTDPAELLDVDWSPLRRLAPVGGAPHADPLYLVCTNGKHDACCAELGRPIAAALSEAHGAAVWEVSHVGGDRFAATVVCLPEGLYLGRVRPGNAVRLIDDLRAGRLDLAHLRGRSSSPFVAQAAEHLLRVDRDLTGVDDIALVGIEDLGDRVFRVGLVAAGAAVAVTVACSEAIDPQQLTCGATSEEHPPRYRLVGIEAAPQVGS
jgi:hypothetical protein